jgi:hypothetical protein
LYAAGPDGRSPCVEPTRLLVGVTARVGNSIRQHRAVQLHRNLHLASSWRK